MAKGEIFPYDVIIEILKRLPVKSLIRFNCVCKDWSKLLRSPHFTAHHLLHHSLHSPFLLLQRLRHPLPPSASSSFCLIGSDLNLHNSRFLHFPSRVAYLVASCNGLLCLRHTDNTLSICNPATRRSTQVPPTLIDSDDFYYVGFGFSPIVHDYKIVRISVCESDKDEGDYQIVLPDKVHVDRVEVYSLATGSWREIDVRNLQNLCPISNSVAADGALFWKATMMFSDSVQHDADEFVVSFDIGREVFTRLKGPPAPAETCSNVLAVYNNKLAMFHHFVIGNFQGSSIDLWVLDNTNTCASDGERWIKQYSVGPFSRMIYPQSIWRDEIVCREELSEHNDESGRVETALSLFNPCSNELKNLPAHRNENCYIAFNYAESLVQVANIQLQH